MSPYSPYSALSPYSAPYSAPLIPPLFRWHHFAHFVLYLDGRFLVLLWRGLLTI